MSDERQDPPRVGARNVALSDEAIAWIVRLGSGSATAEDRAAFDAWQRRSPAHAQAAATAAAIMHDIGGTRQVEEYREIGMAFRHVPPTGARRMNRRALLAGGACVVAAAGVIASGALGPPAGLLAEHATRVGERQRVVLDDGSVAWLNTATALSTHFSDRERRLTLAAGEALFEVANGPVEAFRRRLGGR